MFQSYESNLNKLAESKTTLWKGFSPRWTLPTKLRNPARPTRNTSTILMIIDTRREV